MLWVVSVTLGGISKPLSELRADLTIHHGRSGAFDEPAASTCQIVMLEVAPDFVAAFRVGGELVVSVANGGAPVPRFTGRVTDAALDVDAFTVIATGKLSELGQYEIGLVTWPEEPWVDRVERVFAEAGLSALLELEAPGLVFNPVLAARDPLDGSTTLDAELGQLAAMVGAAVTDRPDGRILVQPLGERDFDALTVPGHNGDIDPADVAYAPVWSQVLPAGNIVTVSYTPGEALPPRPANLVDNSPTVVGLSSTLDILPGNSVSGTGIPANTVVQAIVSPSSVTLSRPANLDALKDGAIHPGETKIGSISDTSDLSVGMAVPEPPGDLQPGTVVVDIDASSVTIDKPAVGTNVGAFRFTAPASSVLTFGTESAYVTHRDEASISRYGERPVSVDTAFVDVLDADRRATERLQRAALPAWVIPAAPIVRGLELRVGYPVVISGMPASSPSTDWLAILEGWSEQIAGEEWTMELALSDPLLSGYFFSWSTIPPEWAWNELDPTASWYEAQSLEAIIP